MRRLIGVLVFHKSRCWNNFARGVFTAHTYEWSDDMRREQQENLIADYLKRGGIVQRLPTPKPIAISDVVEYLQERHFVVYAAPRGEGEPKFVCQGSVVNLQELVSFANAHRAARQLTPFQLVPQIH